MSHSNIPHKTNSHYQHSQPNTTAYSLTENMLNRMNRIIPIAKNRSITVMRRTQSYQLPEEQNHIRTQTEQSYQLPEEHNRISTKPDTSRPHIQNFITLGHTLTVNIQPYTKTDTITVPNDNWKAWPLHKHKAQVQRRSLGPKHFTKLSLFHPPTTHIIF